MTRGLCLIDFGRELADIPNHLCPYNPHALWFKKQNWEPAVLPPLARDTLRRVARWHCQSSTNVLQHDSIDPSEVVSARGFEMFAPPPSREVASRFKDY